MRGRGVFKNGDEFGVTRLRPDDEEDADLEGRRLRPDEEDDADDFEGSLSEGEDLKVPEGDFKNEPDGVLKPIVVVTGICVAPMALVHGYRLLNLVLFSDRSASLEPSAAKTVPLSQNPSPDDQQHHVSGKG